MRYEYTVAVRGAEPDLQEEIDMLDSQGRAGWELTGVVSAKNLIRYYFKKAAD